MGFSEKQRKYIESFIFRSDLLIDDLFASIDVNSNWQDELEKKLDQGSLLINGATAALTIALVAAPATGGASFAAAGVVFGIAGASIAIAQLGSGVYKVLSGGYQENEEITDIKITADLSKLYFKLVMHEMADILSVAYRNFLDEIIEERSIASFAYFAAVCGVEKLQKDVLDQIKAYKNIKTQAFSIQFKIDPQELVKYLIQNSYKMQLSINLIL